MASGICYQEKLTGGDESGVLYGYKEGCNCRNCSGLPQGDKELLLKKATTDKDEIAD